MMSHPANDEITDALNSMIGYIVDDMDRIRDFINNDREKLGFLTPLQIEFLNKVHFAVKSYEQGGGVSKEEFKYNHPVLAGMMEGKTNGKRSQENESSTNQMHVERKDNQ